MRKLRSVFSLVLVFSILCPALCAVALADDESLVFVEDESLEPTDDMSVPLSVSLNSADSSVSLFSSSADIPCTIDLSSNINFGVSGGQSSFVSAGPYDGVMGKRKYFPIYTLSEPTTGLYIQSDNLSVTVTWPVSASYPDVESIDLYGSVVSRFYYTDGQNWPYVACKNATLHINGTALGPAVSFGEKFDYTYKLSKGEVVSSVSIVYFFGNVFDLMATDYNSNTRRLVFSSSNIASDIPTANTNNSTSGWFHALFDWLADIRDGISGVLSGISSGFTNVVNSIIALPEKIADAVKGLFVPSDSQIDELKASFNSLLSEKLGFVYQAGSLVSGVFNAVFDAVDNPDSVVSFTVPAFPAFNVGGSDVSLWVEPIVVDIAQNQVVQTVQQVASPFVIGVMVWGFVHSMEDAFLAFVGGKSLSDWVRERKGEKE